MARRRVFLILLAVVTFALCVHRTATQPTAVHFDIQQAENAIDTSEGDSPCADFWCANDEFYLANASISAMRSDLCDSAFLASESTDFYSIAERIFRERLRKILAAKIDANDGRVTRIMKNSFRQCFNSLHPSRHLQAHHDIFYHLQGLGGAPYLSMQLDFNTRRLVQLIDQTQSNSSKSDIWDTNRFNAALYFEVEASHATRVFFSLEVGRCGDLVCLKFSPDNFGNFDGELEAFGELFDTLEDTRLLQDRYKQILVDEVHRPAVERKQAFVAYRSFIWSELAVPEGSLLKIRDLASMFPEQFEVDWLQVINGELLRGSRLTEDDEVLIEGGIEVLQNLVYFILSEPEISADTFALTFLYDHRDDLITPAAPSSVQNRWSTCIASNHQRHMMPALLVMYEQLRSFWDQTHGNKTNVVEGAERLAQEAVDAFSEWFIERRDQLPAPEAGADITEKLIGMRIAASLRGEILGADRLEEFYEELELAGGENFLRSAWEMRRFHRRVLNEPVDSWRRQIDEVVGGKGEGVVGRAWYDAGETNVLYIPPASLIYPWFHPQRPRFFNMATLYADVIAALTRAVAKITGDSLKLPQSQQFSYDAYKQWLESNREKKLRSDFASLQLFWIASMMTREGGGEGGESGSFGAFDRLTGFREAFACNDVKDSENFLVIVNE